MVQPSAGSPACRWRASKVGRRRIRVVWRTARHRDPTSICTGKSGPTACFKTTSFVVPDVRPHRVRRPLPEVFASRAPCAAGPSSYMKQPYRIYMRMKILKIKTSQLTQAYEVSGSKQGEPLFLVHGWPDSPRTWDQVLPALHKAGYRTIVPYLRGYGLSSFRDPIFGKRTRRTGQPVAFAQDMIHLADHLRLDRFHFVGTRLGCTHRLRPRGALPRTPEVARRDLRALPTRQSEAAQATAGTCLLVPVAALYQARRAELPSRPYCLRQSRSGTPGVPKAGTPKRSSQRPRQAGRERTSRTWFPAQLPLTLGTCGARPTLRQPPGAP